MTTTALSDKARCVLAFLSRYCTPQGQIFVNPRTLVERARIGPDEVDVVLDELVRCGEVVDLARHGDGYKMTVVKEAGAW